MTTDPGVAAGVRGSLPEEGASTRVDGGVPPLPTRAEGVQLIGEMSGSGYRRPPALVRRADGQTITLTPLLYLTLRAVDGRRGYGDIAELLSAATGRHVVPDDVSYLVEKKLRPLGLLADSDGSQPATTKVNPLLALRFKFVVTDEAWTRRLTTPFAWLFRPVLVLGLVAGFLALTWWLLVEQGLGSAVHQAFYEPDMILALWVLIVASAAFHEFGHAAACRFGGASPGAMGGGLYIVWPAFYTEVTDSYRLGRGGRLRVDLGGLYFNAIFALGTLGLWAATRWDALLLVVVAQHLQMVRQLAPFIRADGYHIIADLTGVPDLFAHIGPTLRGVLPRRWRPAQAPALKRWARAVVVTWVFTMVPVLVGLIAFAAMLFPRLAATAWDSMNLQWDAVGHYWSEGDPLGVAVRLTSSLIVCLPVLGLLYLLFRIARRGARWAWHNTEHSPRERAAVLLAGLGVAAAVAWAWWPTGQYEPVAADDQGSLTDLVRIEDGRIFLPLLERQVLPMRVAPASVELAGAPEPVPVALPGTGESSLHTETTRLAEGTTLTHVPAPGPTAVPASSERSSGQPTAAPTSDDQLAVEAAIATADTAELEQMVVAELVENAWPFPFPPPDAPGDGDNMAHAINTLDESTVMDLAVSWAIVTANEVDERNEALALASCEECLTRAVAFQLLLLVTDSDVVVPVNTAVAVNYDCTRCTTEAIAVQLVLSLTAVPSTQAQQLVDAAMSRLAMLETDLATLTSGQIYFVIQSTQAEIVRILAEDGVIPDPATDPAAAGVAEGTATGTATSAPALPTVESSPTATATADPTASGTTEPSTTSTTEPSTSATTEATAEESGTTDPSGSPTTEPSTSSSPGATEPSPTSSPTADGSATPEPTATTSP